MKDKQAKTRYIFYICGLIFLFFYICPYLILGKNSSFRIDDFLDDEIMQYMLSGKYFFTSSDTKVAEWFCGTEKSAIQPPCFILIWFYKFFDFFTATLLSLIAGVFFAYTGMYLFLEKALQKTYYSIICVVSILFAILPFYPSYGLSSLGIPLVVWGLWNLYENQKVYLSYGVIVFYALYSSLVWSGYFVIGFTGIVMLVLLFKKKMKEALRYLISIIIMCVLYVWVFWDTIYGLVFSGVVSHRNNPDRVFNVIPFKGEFIEYFKYGQYHAPSYHTYIMAASLLLIVGLGFLMLFQKKSRQLRNYYIALLVLWLAGLFIAAFAGAYNTQIALDIRAHMKLLNSMQFDRIYWLNPTLWYLILALSAKICFDYIKLYVPSEKFNAILVTTGTVCVAAYMIPYLISKNEVYLSNLNQLRGGENTYITYREYYDEELYSQIAEYIGKDKSQYRVGSLGVAPAVTTMNGFYTIDAYSTNYSMEYKKRFRKVIAKEIEQSEELTWYFDSWGSRCYLFSHELGKNWNITKEDDYHIVWDIDVSALKDLECEYIISAVDIQNSEDLGFELVKDYADFNSLRHIRLYKVM